MTDGRSGSHRVAAALAGIALVGVAAMGVAAPALSGASQSHRATAMKPVTPGSSYLALGDSVSFGYREANNLPPPVYASASSFVGYPEDVGTALDLKVANAACPGETSLSFLKTGVQNKGCESSTGGGPGYRSYFPLHVSYHGTQLQYAVRYLRSHPNTRLVTLMIGANDAFLCQETTPDQCVSELPSVLQQVAADVADILKAVRHSARYQGQIVIVNYYSIDYSNVLDTSATQGLNGAMDSAASPYHVQIADGFGAFQAAAAQAGGNSCAAGLLTELTGGGCGVHPSLAGQALLALAVEQAIQR
jgi:lysophospholipase L1-like esterase